MPRRRGQGSERDLTGDIKDQEEDIRRNDATPGASGIEDEDLKNVIFFEDYDRRLHCGR